MKDWMKFRSDQSKAWALSLAILILFVGIPLVVSFSIAQTAAPSGPVGLKLRSLPLGVPVPTPTSDHRLASEPVLPANNSGAVEDSMTLQPLDNQTAAGYSVIQSIYVFLQEFADQFFTPQFLSDAGFSPAIKNNFKIGYRSDFQPDLGGTARLAPPLIEAYESSQPGFLAVVQDSNLIVVSFRTMATGTGSENSPPLSPGYDKGVVVGDYAGLVATWVVGCPTGFSNSSSSYLLSLNNGLSAWMSYLNDKNSEVYKYASYAIRQSGGRSCDDGTNPGCWKGNQIRNVMMYVAPYYEGTGGYPSDGGVYPFQVPSQLTTWDGPTDLDLSGIFFAAIFYDISNEVGLGDYKSNLLFWKTISMINNCSTFTMTDFYNDLLAAAAALWPDANNPGHSKYENLLKGYLASRMALTNGNWWPSQPTYLQQTRRGTSLGSGSLHPDLQPRVNSYGSSYFTENSYTQLGATAQDYVVYQFYRWSQYGPCDQLILTNGSFTIPTDWSSFNYNGDGTYYWSSQDRQIQNLLFIARGPTIDWVDQTMRCQNEATGFYAEDVSPFGFMIMKATKNGFAYTASHDPNYLNPSYIKYTLSIVDPSQTCSDPSLTCYSGTTTYNWSFSDTAGNSQQLTGTNVTYIAKRNESLHIHIDRLRGSTTDSLDLDEPSNGLDRTDRPHVMDCSSTSGCPYFQPQ